MARRGRRQPGAVIMSAGRAPRIASASIPASPVGTGQAATVTAAAAASGQCRVPVSYLRVWMTCSRLGPGWPVPRRSSAGQPGLFMRAPEGPRPVPRPASGQLGTKPTAIYVTSAMAATGARQSRRAVPSRAGSAGV